MAKRKAKKRKKTAVAVKSTAATDSQKARYLEMAATTVRTLEEGIDLLVTRQVADTLTGTERRLINVELPALQAAHTKVLAEMLAFAAGTQIVRPPSQAQVEEAKKLAAKLDKMIAKSITATTVLNVTTKAIGLYQGTATA